MNDLVKTLVQDVNGFRRTSISIQSWIKFVHFDADESRGVFSAARFSVFYFAFQSM